VIRLPVLLQLPSAEPQPSDEAEDSVDASKYRILVVDDNRDGADSLARMLRLMGHEIHTAYDGEQAVEMADSMRPEIVLLDIGMPKLNGYDAARLIRQQPWGKNMLLIAL